MSAPARSAPPEDAVWAPAGSSPTEHQPDRREAASPEWPRRVALGAGTYAIAAGLVTLAGWATDQPRLTSWKGDGIAMFPNTAGCAVMSGLAIVLVHASSRWTTAVRALGAVVASVGGLTMLEHLVGVDLGLDTLLFDQRPWGARAAAAPMRMGPPASMAFLVAGTALLLLTAPGRARRATAALGLLIVGLGTLSSIGHLYGASQMYMLPRLTGIAMQTASVLVAIGVGLVASLPDREPMRLLLDPGAAGALVRRALPVLVALSVGLGAVRVFIERQGLVDGPFGSASRTLVELGLLTGLLWLAAARVKAHERALRASEADVRRHASQLAAVLDTAAVAIHAAGADGTILWANDAEVRMLGYARDEYVGRRMAEFHLDRHAVEDMLARLHRGERLHEYPARVRCKDGSVKDVVIDASALWDEGRFVHLQCFTRDVSERKAAEEARALLAAIIEASSDAIVSKTLDGVITSWNQGAERIFGYRAAEAVGQRIDLIIPPDRQAEEREIQRRLRLGQRIGHFETVRRTKDGRAIDISLTVSPLKDATGTVIGASKIARDVTDRKLAEAEREEASRRKDEFIAILAHELRNPLAPVRNAVRFLRLKGGGNPELRRPVEMIERQVAQMARLIDDLLDVSRISRGMLELRREHVWCSEVVEAAVEACRDEIQAKGHHLTVTMPPEPPELEADRERLVQVLCNLLGNAAKYTPAGGHIDLTIATAEDRTLRISIKDDGLGIPPGKLTTIFDLFTRVEHSLDGQGGLGIGLTLVRQVVELHRGRIEARSRGLGHGSEFVVTLPILAEASAAAAPAPVESRASQPLRMLVADDNADAVESLALLLRLAGHEVHTAFDGAAAIEAIERLSPQVALIDIGMPEANGYDVARRVRSRAGTRQPFLVALTGWGQDADRRRAHEAGFDAHLVKPVAPETLDELLASLPASGGDHAPRV